MFLLLKVLQLLRGSRHGGNHLVFAILILIILIIMPSLFLPLFIIFSYGVGLIITSIRFNRELVNYRTSLTGDLATTESLDVEQLAFAIKRHYSSLVTESLRMHFHAPLVPSLLAKLFAGNHSDGT